MICLQVDMRIPPLSSPPPPPLLNSEPSRIIKKLKILESVEINCNFIWLVTCIQYSEQYIEKQSLLLLTQNEWEFNFLFVCYWTFDWTIFPVFGLFCFGSFIWAKGLSNENFIKFKSKIRSAPQLATCILNPHLYSIIPVQYLYFCIIIHCGITKKIAVKKQ